MRVILLSMLFVAPVMIGTSVAQEDSPSEQAIQEAITILQARMALVDADADREKIGRAITSLAKHLPGNDQDVAPEPLKITLAQLKKKLQAKAAFNAKTNELTLVYDLTKPDQLRDFELNGAKPAMRGGVLRIGPADTLRHIVKFATVSVGGQIVVENIGLGQGASPFIRTTAGVAACVGETNGPYLKLVYDGKDLSVKRADRKQIENSPLSMIFLVSDAKASIKINNSEFAGQIDPKDAGQIELLGGLGGLYVRSLVISGTLDEEWATAFFTD